MVELLREFLTPAKARIGSTPAAPCFTLDVAGPTLSAKFEAPLSILTFRWTFECSRDDSRGLLRSHLTHPLALMVQALQQGAARLKVGLPHGWTLRVLVYSLRLFHALPRVIFPGCLRYFFAKKRAKSRVVVLALGLPWTCQWSLRRNSLTSRRLRLALKSWDPKAKRLPKTARPSASVKSLTTLAERYTAARCSRFMGFLARPMTSLPKASCRSEHPL